MGFTSEDARLGFANLFKAGVLPEPEARAVLFHNAQHQRRRRAMLLDEPSMGLSPLLVEQIFTIIRDINNQGTSILLVEQNAQMALSIADRAYVLETGRVVLEGTGQELLQNEMVAEAYLGGGH